jgi:hypothetical protein
LPENRTVLCIRTRCNWGEILASFGSKPLYFLSRLILGQIIGFRSRGRSHRKYPRRPIYASLALLVVIDGLAEMLKHPLRYVGPIERMIDYQDTEECSNSHVKS